VRTGLSYVNENGALKTRVVTVSCTPTEGSAPSGVEHKTAVSDIHDVLRQRVFSREIVGDPLNGAKFSPSSVNEPPPVVGALTRFSTVTIGASYVKDWGSVPLIVLISTDTSLWSDEELGM